MSLKGQEINCIDLLFHRNSLSIPLVGTSDERDIRAVGRIARHLSS